MTTQPYYGQEELWKRSVAPYQMQVLADLVDLVPAGSRRILDVGCGDGKLTAAFPEEWRVVGVDLSRAALRHLSGRSRVASAAERLPFPDRAFDVVLATDILEHLSEVALRRTLAELQRVSSGSVLVTVPYGEQLEAAHARCASCQTVYHVNWHQRSFVEADLAGLLPAPWELAELRYSGSMDRSLFDPTVPVRQELGRYFRWEHGVCPQCGGKEQEAPSVDGSDLPDDLLFAFRQELWSELGWLERHMNRTEIIAHYRYRATPAVPRATTRPVEERLASRLDADFSNPLQAVSDGISEGFTWTRFRLADGAALGRAGVVRRADHADPAGIRVYLPVTLGAGDRIVIEASGSRPTDLVSMSVVDGLVGQPERVYEGPVTRHRQRVELTFRESVPATQYGACLDLALAGKAVLHALRLEPRDGPVRPSRWLRARPPYQVVLLTEGTPRRTFGLRVEREGWLPMPSAEPFAGELPAWSANDLRDWIAKPAGANVDSDPNAAHDETHAGGLRDGREEDPAGVLRRLSARRAASVAPDSDPGLARCLVQATPATEPKGR